MKVLNGIGTFSLDLGCRFPNFYRGVPTDQILEWNRDARIVSSLNLTVEHSDGEVDDTLVPFSTSSDGEGDD